MAKIKTNISTFEIMVLFVGFGVVILGFNFDKQNLYYWLYNGLANDKRYLSLAYASNPVHTSKHKCGF